MEGIEIKAAFIIAAVECLSLISCQRHEVPPVAQSGAGWARVVVQSVKPWESDGVAYLFELKLKRADGTVVTADSLPRHINTGLLSVGQSADVIISQPHGYATDRYRIESVKGPSNKPDAGDG